MTALGEWLKQLIFIVVLAAFSDLLLPTKSMQKYVRMVMGLAIIGLMLQPILPFMNRDWADHMAAAAAQEVEQGNGQSPVPSSADITRLRDRLSADQDRQANQFAAQELSRQLSAQLNCKPVTIQVTGVRQGAAAIAVTVTVNRAQVNRGDEIRKAVANDLGIDSSQVTVSSAGGG